MVKRTRVLFAVGLAVAVGLGGSWSAAEARLARAGGAAVTAGYVPVQYWYGPAYPYAYPYPYRYGPPAYVPPPGYAAPPVYTGPQPSGQAPAQSQSWYYCDNPPGYYPNVTACNTAWRQVPAKPAQ